MTSYELPVRISRRAQAEIGKTVFYRLKRWGDEQANRYQKELRNSFRELTRLPFMGPKRTDISRGIRSWTVGSHIVLYRVRNGEIVVNRVVHARQDPGIRKA